MQIECGARDRCESSESGEWGWGGTSRELGNWQGQQYGGFEDVDLRKAGTGSGTRRKAAWRGEARKVFRMWIAASPAIRSSVCAHWGEPSRGDLAVGQRDQSMIGNGPAMGIATEILEHIFGAAEGRFGVNHPVLSEPWSQPGSEDLGLREQSQVPGKMKLAMLKSRLETDDEFAAKHAPEYAPSAPFLAFVLFDPRLHQFLNKCSR